MALPHQFCARAISMSLRRTCVAPSLVLIENAKCSPEAKCVGWLFQSLHSCEVAQPPSTSATTALTTIWPSMTSSASPPCSNCLASHGKHTQPRPVSDLGPTGLSGLHTPHWTSHLRRTLSSNPAAVALVNG